MGSFALAVLTTVFVAAPLPETTATSSQLDAAVAEAWKGHLVSPAPTCDDATFLRRIWLDFAGRIPPAAETKKFLEERSSKRQRSGGQAASSPEFANHWGRVWAEYFTDQRPFDQETHSGRVLQNYFRDSFLAGKSYKQMATELLRGRWPERRQWARQFSAAIRRAAGATGRRGEQKIPGSHHPVCPVPRPSARPLEAGRILGSRRLFRPAAQNAADRRAQWRQFLARY